MKPSRFITKLGLLIATAGGAIVASWPKLALALADVSDWLTAAGVRLACYGG